MPSNGLNALRERAIRGQGELPLVSFVRVLPPGVAIVCEFPLKSSTEASDLPLERTRRILQATHLTVELHEYYLF